MHSYEEDVWSPTAEKLRKVDEVKTYLDNYRDNSQESEALSAKTKFYAALFAEHLSQVPEEEVEGIEEVCEHEYHNINGIDKDDDEQGLHSKQEDFIASCESNSLTTVHQGLSFANCQLTHQGIKNLVSFLNTTEMTPDVDALLKQIDTASLLPDKEFQASVLVMLGRSENAVVSGFLVSWIDHVMSHEDCAPIAVKFVHTIIAKLGIEDSLVQVLRSLLQSKVLTEYNLAILEPLVLKDLNLIEVCSRNPDLILQLAVLIQTTSAGSPTLNKSSKFGTFVVGAIKKLPTEIPKQSFDLLLQSIQFHKSFLKKSAYAELQKHCSM